MASDSRSAIMLAWLAQNSRSSSWVASGIAASNTVIWDECGAVLLSEPR